MGDEEAVIPLIAGFRVALAKRSGRRPAVDVSAHWQELRAYQRRGYPIFVAESEAGQIGGYLVCRVEEDVVWAESLYVEPAWRRKGVGSALYGAAEKLAQERGSDTVYNWVHPDNEEIVAFLKKRGYGVLNLVELRRQRPGEVLAGKIQVGKHSFDY